MEVYCPQCKSSNKIRTIQLAMELKGREMFVPIPCVLSCECGNIWDVPAGVNIVHVGQGQFMVEDKGGE